MNSITLLHLPAQHLMQLAALSSHDVNANKNIQACVCNRAKS